MVADLPGVSKENLQLRVESDTLTIEATMSLTTPEGMEASHAEVGVARYRRVFTLSKGLDSGKHGVLTLHIPKAEHTQPHKFAVKVG